MKTVLRYALLLAGMTTLPAMAHIGYTGRNFGVFDGSPAVSTLSNLTVTGNWGWIDGTDSDYGDSHRVAPFRFTLLNPADVTLTFQGQAFTPDTPGATPALGGLQPGFSLYKGLAHLSPQNADYDNTEISKANRPADSEGSFRALNDWVIGNDPNTENGIPASLSFFQYVGHAYDGGGAGSDGVFDGKVSHSFINLPAGDYSVFVGGSDYSAQKLTNPDVMSRYGLSGSLVVSAVPEPETYAMLLVGLGLMGTLVRRRGSAPGV